MMTHYQRLGVARDAPAEVIRAAFKALAQSNHPDKNLDNPAAVEVMQEINQAYAVLNDPQKRAEYDQWLARQEEAVQAEWTQPPSPPSSARAPDLHQQMHGIGKKITVILFFVSLVGAMLFSFAYYAFFSGAPVAAVPAAPPPPVPRASSAPARTAATQAVPAPTSQKQLADCVFAAAKAYDVPPAVLLGLLSTEEGAAGKKTPAADKSYEDKSYDLGLLQINTWWVPQLARLWHVSNAQAESMVRNNACVNVGVGAWIFHATAARGGSMAAKVARYDFSAHHLATHPGDGHSAYVAKALQMIKLYKNVHTPEDLLGNKDKN